MKAVVIGAGVIGVTTAYFLRRRGHDVTVIDREEGPGRQTSFANGALLTPSMAEPWNAPGCWRALVGSVGRSDTPLQLRLSALPSLACWGVRFLRNSSVSAFDTNTRSNLRLALHSLQVMQSLRQQTGIEYGVATPGTLKIFRNPGSLDRAAERANRLTSEGLAFRRLSPTETVELEPALAPIAEQVAGALHFVLDETGDAHRFCVALAESLRQRGVEFRFNTEVSKFELSAARVLAVVCRRERVRADHYVVAAGSYSTPILRLIGVNLPVQPAKGYSVTFDSAQNQSPLRIPVVDDDWHAAVVPIDRAIRVAGTAEFAGFDQELDPNRVRNLLGLLREVLPQDRFDSKSARAWCGLRPMSADGVPIIGRTRLANVWVSTGHGHLGWTMAAGSADLLADLMDGRVPAVDPALYELKRFGN